MLIFAPGTLLLGRTESPDDEKNKNPYNIDVINVATHAN